MVHLCRHCGIHFTPTATLRWYCSEECQRAAHERACEVCGRLFLGKIGNPGRYCSNECHGQAKHNAAMARAEARCASLERVCDLCDTVFVPKRGNKGPYCSRVCTARSKLDAALRGAASRRDLRPLVMAVCAAGGACLTPSEPLPSRRARYHHACLHAVRTSGQWTPPRTGAVIACQECGRDIGYRSPSELCQKYCADCAVHKRTSRTRKGMPVRHRLGEVVPCAFHGCATMVYVEPGRLKRSVTHACCRAHSRAALRLAGQVHCTACGGERYFRPSAIPQAVDRSTMTWVCSVCRPKKTTVREFECLYCHMPVLRRVLVDGPVGDRFCRAAHRDKYYHEMRRRSNPCRYCGAIIQRKGSHVTYCNWDCYTAAKQGRPLQRHKPSKAELRIKAAYRKGVRGVRPLAAVSKTSKTTVQKLIAAGKIAA